MPAFRSTPRLLKAVTSSVSSGKSSSPKHVTVFGGTGYVGSRVCERLVNKGYAVTAVSRRGTNPRPNDEGLTQVNWVAGDATDPETVKDIVKDTDAVVHAIGLLFDAESGLGSMNKFVSGVGSLPDKTSTYDAVTRKTMFNLLDAIESTSKSPTLEGNTTLFPVCFVSAAEAGWPEMNLGSTVEKNLAPQWLKNYLGAKRKVEERLNSSTAIRSCIYRPALIWDWTKFSVLPVIPFINIANTIGVPFVDKAVQVETLADAIVQGIEDESVEGIQRYMQIEELASRAEPNV